MYFLVSFCQIVALRQFKIVFAPEINNNHQRLSPLRDQRQRAEARFCLLRVCVCVSGACLLCVSLSRCPELLDFVGTCLMHKLYRKN